MSYVLHNHTFIGIISGSYQAYLGRGTTILIAVAQRTPFWTVDSVDPSLSDATQLTMLEYSAGRVVSDSYTGVVQCSSFHLILTSRIKAKEGGKVLQLDGCSPFCMKNKQDNHVVK